VRCKLSVNPEEIELDEDLAVAVFRIFQEALTNVHRHAEATRVDANLEVNEQSLILAVHDNGKGITRKQIWDSQSFGLIGIKERARMFGGEVKIKGKRKKGTTLTARVPMD
jgi:signal transduction histidine kinase